MLVQLGTLQRLHHAPARFKLRNHLLDVIALQLAVIRLELLTLFVVKHLRPQIVVRFHELAAPPPRLIPQLLCQTRVELPGRDAHQHALHVFVSLRPSVLAVLTALRRTPPVPGRGIRTACSNTGRG